MDSPTLIESPNRSWSRRRVAVQVTFAMVGEGSVVVLALWALLKGMSVDEDDTQRLAWWAIPVDLK